MLSDTNIKGEHANMVVEIGMEEGTLVLVQPKSTIAITPSFVFTMEDSRVDVRLEEIEAIVMEKYVENVIMNM
jgi:hypothetical protein